MKILRLTICLLLAPLCSFCWNASGHSVAGAIAYTYLKKNNPAVLQKVLRSFQMHPWYQTRWADSLNKVAPDQKGITLFMLASVWPDEVRKIQEYGGGDKSKWHYINYPFVPKGETTTPGEPDKINAVDKLNDLLSELKTQPESEEKAINLCWLFHILEDLHQPLHTVALFDASHPTGDRGGNDTYFKFKDSTGTHVLHSYWDRLVAVDHDAIPAYAQNLLATRAYKISKLKELKSNKTVEAWVKNESLPLAINQAYQNGTIRGTKENATIVDHDYDQENKVLAERRVVLAGIRLAQRLVQIYS